MACLIKKSYGPSLLLFLDCFRANQMGCEQVFDNLTFERMDALIQIQIQFLIDYVLKYRFWIHAMFGRF